MGALKSAPIIVNYMIIIVSQSSEESTNQVIDWLDFLGASFKRVNGCDFEASSKKAFLYSITDKKSKLSMDGVNLSTSVQSVWYRRWIDTDYFGSVILKGVNSGILDHTVANHLTNESIELAGAIATVYEDAAWLNHPGLTRINKLDVLQKATKLGLVVPETIITNSKKELNRFLSRSGKVITKSIYNMRPLAHDGEIFSQYTTEVSEEVLTQIPDFFFPSLFQKSIDKNFEIRTFFLEGEFYSIAIFSQQDQRSKNDFRKYNFEVPVRESVYALPNTLKKKLFKLMQHFNLNSASLDLIKSMDGEYVFLEINPLGQFGMVSLPGNFYLEKKIAQTLIKKDEKNKK